MTFLVAAVGPIASSIASGPTVLFSDDFNRANQNPIAGNWSTQGGGFAGLEISSNKADGTTGGNCASYVNAVTPDADCYAQCAISDSGIPGGGGPCVRMATAANSMYGLQLFAGPTAALFYMAAGSYNSLALQVIAYTPGDVFKVEANGTAIKGYQNGVEILSATDANLTSGRAGLYAFGSANKFDDFECGNL